MWNHRGGKQRNSSLGAKPSPDNISRCVPCHDIAMLLTDSSVTHLLSARHRVTPRTTGPRHATLLHVQALTKASVAEGGEARLFIPVCCLAALRRATAVWSRWREEGGWGGSNPSDDTANHCKDISFKRADSVAQCHRKRASVESDPGGRDRHACPVVVRPKTEGTSRC